MYFHRTIIWKRKGIFQNEILKFPCYFVFL